MQWVQSVCREPRRLVGWLAAAVVVGVVACLAAEALPPPDQSRKVVKAVVVPSTASLVAGQTQSFSAYGLTADSTQTLLPVVWSATGGTIDANGVFTAGTTPCTCTVSAESPDWGVSANAQVAISGSTSAVSSVTVQPDSAWVPVDGAWPFSTLLQDASGLTLTGRSVAWSSADQTVATVTGSGLTTGHAPGATTITAVAEGKSGAGVLTVLPQGSGAWPNEPAVLPTIADNSFSVLNGNGWDLLDNTLGLVTLGSDPNAPLSPPSVLQYLYPIGFGGGTGPGAESIDLPSVKSVYVGTWWKVSNPWQGHPTNVNKVEIFFPAEGGDIYMVMYGTPGGPYELRVIPQFHNMPSNWMLPNVNHVPVTLGVWHRVEWLMIYNTTSSPPNGVIRWWLDGKLLGDYSNVQFPSTGLVTYKVSAIWGGVGGVKTENDYYWYDHVHISGR
jgi:hypothetical protein